MDINTVTELTKKKIALCVAIKTFGSGETIKLFRDGKDVCTISYSRWFQSSDWGVELKEGGLIFHYNVVDIPFDSFERGLRNELD